MPGRSFFLALLSLLLVIITLPKMFSKLVHSIFRFTLCFLFITLANFSQAAEVLPHEVVAGYNVFVGTDPADLRLYDIVVGKTELLLTDLEPNTTYYISVQAFNAEGATSGMSPQITVSTEDGTPPLAPTGLFIESP